MTWRNRYPLRVIAAFVLTASFAFLPGRTAAEDSEARLFAAHALTLRAAVISGEQRATEFLTTLPGIGMREEETLLVLWSPFFANAVVKLGRIRAPVPAALYYNPLLDIAVLTLWERTEEGYRVRSARALPGERLANPSAIVSVLPLWMAEGHEAVETLMRNSAARLRTFSSSHPAQSREPGRAATTFAADAQDMRTALPRLVWYAMRRARWTDGTMPWLELTLAGIESALAEGNPAVLLAVAPETDEESATVLARLPAGFVEALALDMVLEAGEGDRLLIGSMPEDGDVYLLVLCTLEGSACAIRRFMLLSLLS